MGYTRRQFMSNALAAGSLAALGPGAVARADDLITKTIPSTGERIPVIGLGTNRYGVGDSAEARAPLGSALAKFAELGGTVIDTAPMYRTSESVLGDLIGDLGIRDDLFIATKVDEAEGGDATRAQMQRSLDRLHTRRFELMQVHNLIAWREALPEMRDWKAEGRVRYIGITTSREAQYDEFVQVMQAEELDFVQVNYSLEQRLAAERILPLAADRGMAVMINRAFGGGRLFERVGNQPLPDWATAFGAESWAQFLLKYAVSHPAATVAIPGMTKARHVEDNMQAARGRLPDAEERRRMETFFDSL